MRACMAICAFLAPFGVQVAAAVSDYPRPELLLEPTALSRPETAKGYVVLDARERKQFDKSRIPGAVWVDVAAWGKAFKDGKDAAAWSERIGGLGIAAGSSVAIYDDKNFNDAARIWWLLKFWGVKDARLLHGNWTGWQKAGLPIEADKPKSVVPARFAARSGGKRLATKQLLLDSLKEQSLQLVDARSEGEFCGVDLRKNKRGGAIPGAKHLDWIELIDKPNQRFKSPEQLRKLFREAGIDLERPSATYCQSGGRASVMVFAMELLGAKDASNYYASWGEWGNDKDTPIVVRKEKKPGSRAPQ